MRLPRSACAVCSAESAKRLSVRRRASTPPRRRGSGCQRLPPAARRRMKPPVRRSPTNCCRARATAARASCFGWACSGCAGGQAKWIWSCGTTWNARLGTAHVDAKVLCVDCGGPAGDVIAAGGRDWGIRLICAHTEAKIMCPAGGTQFLGHARPVISVHFSPDDTKPVSASWGKTVSVWDPSTGACLSRLRCDSRVFRVSWSPDGTRIAAGSIDKTVRIVDSASGAPVGSPLLGRPWRRTRTGCRRFRGAPAGSSWHRGRPTAWLLRRKRACAFDPRVRAPPPRPGAARGQDLPGVTAVAQ